MGTDLRTLWTLGYEGRAQHDVVGLLVEAGVELLVDVRIRPQSRKPGLSKTALSGALHHEDIDYVSRRELGTPLDIRGLFRARQLDEARAAYRAYLLDEAAEDLDWLAVQAGERHTAILCFEFRAAECHRRVIAEELASRHGFTIIDL